MRQRTVRQMRWPLGHRPLSVWLADFSLRGGRNQECLPEILSRQDRMWPDWEKWTSSWCWRGCDGLLGEKLQRDVNLLLDSSRWQDYVALHQMLRRSILLLTGRSQPSPPRLTYMRRSSPTPRRAFFCAVAGPDFSGPPRLSSSSFRSL